MPGASAWSGGSSVSSASTSLRRPTSQLRGRSGERALTGLSPIRPPMAATSRGLVAQARARAVHRSAGAATSQLS